MEFLSLEVMNQLNLLNAEEEKLKAWNWTILNLKIRIPKKKREQLTMRSLRMVLRY